MVTGPYMKSGGRVTLRSKGDRSAGPSASEQVVAQCGYEGCAWRAGPFGSEAIGNIVYFEHVKKVH